MNSNIPQEILKYLLDRHLRVNRMQYYLYNVKDIIVLFKHWWIIPMYIATKTPNKSGPDNTGGVKTAPDYVTKKDFDEFKQIVLAYIARQEEFNKQQLEFNKAIATRLDNLVKRNNLKE